MINQNKSIDDLVRIPAVETVIQLTTADSRDKEQTRALLSSFVITDEIESAFRQIFDRITDSQGIGGFVKGNYGSGKSHFLAVLSLLLEAGDTWDNITYPLLEQYSPLRDQKFLVVKIALHNYAADSALETIVFDEIEKSFQARFGQPAFLRGDRALLSQFNRYILPQHPEFLTSEKIAANTWDQRCSQNPREATLQATAFLRKHNIALKTSPDRRKAIRILGEQIQKKSLSGILFAVDELSEFLKAKSDSAAFTEDLRFLQFIGESCKENPFYFIATLQEHIEQTGYIDEDLVYRIKDRFPLRFSLSEHHVQQLIATRLIRKKEGALEEIRKLFDHYQSSFPQAAIVEEDFVQIYPVHPATVRMLEGLTPLFSQHRGVVDFIYHQLTGDVNRDWKGMLSLPADTLLTPDMIFNHFHERIREHPDLNAYSEVVYRSLDKDIPVIFKETADQRIALKIVKILILVEISPIEKRSTIQALAEMVNEPVSDADTGLNYQYLEEVILGKLIKEGSYINRAETESGQHTYFISLEQTTNQMVRSRIQEIAKQSHTIQDIFPVCLPYLQNSLIPFTLLDGTPRRKQTIHWQNTQRSGWIYYQPHSGLGPMEMETILQQMKAAETDFALFIRGLFDSDDGENPQFGFESLKDRFAPSLIGWVPGKLKSDERQFLNRFYAHARLAGDLKQGKQPRDRQMLSLVHEWLEENNHALVTLVEDAYLGGKLFNHQGEIAFKFSMVYTDFRHLVQQIMTPVLQALFPRHSEIMPGDVIQPFALEKLYLQFIRPGQLDKTEARSRHLDNLIRSCAVPLGLVADEGEHWTVTTQFGDNSLGQKILTDCERQSSTDLYALYWQYRKSDWGVSKYQFNLILAALISSGRLVGFQSGNVVPFHSIEQLTDGSIDAVGAGELISDELQQALAPFLKAPAFEDIPTRFSVAVQEQLWRKMKQYRDHVSGLLEKQNVLGNRYEGYPFYQTLRSRTESDLVLLRDFVDAFRSSYSATRGLEKLALDLGTDQLSRIPAEVEALQTLTNLMESRFAELNQMYAYLHHPLWKKNSSHEAEHLRETYQQLYSEMEDVSLTTDNQVRELTQTFYRFKSEYIQWYRQAHDDYYTHKVFTRQQKVQSEPVYQLLQRLNKLESVLAQPDWITVQDMLLDMPRPCQRQIEKQLMTNPFCECGFLPGDAYPERRDAQIREQAVTGVISVLSQLRTTYRWAMEEYIDNLKQISDTQTAKNLERVLDFPESPGDKHFARWLLLMNDKVIQAIDAAIKGKVLIVQRPVQSLVKALTGKQMVVREIRAIFEDWLTRGEKLDDETHLRIIGERELPELSTGHYTGARTIIREDGFRFYEAFWLLVWVYQHQQQAWLEWVRNRFRYQSEDPSVILEIVEALSSREDKSRMAVYFERQGMVERLGQLVDFSGMSRADLMTFIEKETFLSPLSVDAVTRLLNQVNPTESLPGDLSEYSESLATHPNRQRWSHLVFAWEYLQVIRILARTDTADNPMAHYLESGWQLPGLVSEIQQNNRGLRIVEEERVERLRKEVERWRDQLVRDNRPVRKKELPLPYFDIEEFPVRLANLLKNPPVVMLIIDALRWDVWRGLKPLFEKILGSDSLTYYAAMEAASPTTTDKNRPLLINNLSAACGALDWYLETVSEDSNRQREILQRFQQQQEMMVLNTTIVDSQLHTHSDPFPTMIDVITTRIEALIIPLLRQIPEGTTLVITADHGFIEDRKGYRHGGDSFFEKVVPFTVWRTEG